MAEFPGAEEAALQASISQVNGEIAVLMASRRDLERRVYNLRHKPSRSMLRLAAKHLDPSEGVMREGRVVEYADVAAVRKLIDFVAAHIECEDGSQ